MYSSTIGEGLGGDERMGSRLREGCDDEDGNGKGNDEKYQRSDSSHCSTNTSNTPAQSLSSGSSLILFPVPQLDKKYSCIEPSRRPRYGGNAYHLGSKSYLHPIRLDLVAGPDRPIKYLRHTDRLDS